MIDESNLFEPLYGTVVVIWAVVVGRCTRRDSRCRVDCDQKTNDVDDRRCVHVFEKEFEKFGLFRFDVVEKLKIVSKYAFRITYWEEFKILGWKNLF